MGVQLPRSPVRLSLFRCSSLFVSLSDSLCFVVRLSLFRCSSLFVPLFGSLVALSHSLAWFVLFSFICARTIYILSLLHIYYLFFYMGVKSGWVVFLISWRKPFPHPRRFFGFNTSCFWRGKVLYLYRDMGGASAPPFFCYFPFKNGDFRSASGKNLPSSNFDLPSSNFSFPSSK